MDPQTEKKLIRQIVRQARAFARLGCRGRRPKHSTIATGISEHAVGLCWAALKKEHRMSRPSLSSLAQVHPDLFGAYPYERSKNSDALKARGLGA